MEYVPKKTTPTSPDQPPLIPTGPVPPDLITIDEETLKRLAQENQAAVREQREEEAEKPDYTDV